ncbi:hypothetical protein CMQ_5614 [Grosmannia clavigera kw1407]|uniref:Uncharacterized protein n=1 Tax=Grosmannia clavigera (strain kw1407 / UAMH 11150) TaxID=655863 RepID=F0XSR8_GROCL|nr:uncharacterized protein CMQ_5614 [Grosmannia clavigera kw1407]EFW99193.1 hypothetical protein CMQ_5614 [Grosmannia clavigera kw1407]
MCYRLVERFSVCGCVYHQHAVDRCAAYNQSGHKIQERIIPVGYTCSLHSEPTQGSYGDDTYTYSDSGYYSGQSHQSSKYR